MKKQQPFFFTNKDVKCPDCGKPMVALEEGYDDMTDGQQADSMAGFNRPFQCVACGHYGLFDVPMEDF